STVLGQAGTVHWNNGNGVGAWSNAQSGGGMHPPGSLTGQQDPQYSYGYAGIDSRGASYGGAGGNGAYYVGGTDEHGRPFSYGNQAGQPGYMGIRPDPNYPGVYGYRNAATSFSTATASATAALALAVALASGRL
ncbi:hypothetical protein KR018_000603, partial [Drosophila ironensis]